MYLSVSTLVAAVLFPAAAKCQLWGNNSKVENTTSIFGRLPNPCTDSFRSPVYEISKLTASSVYSPKQYYPDDVKQVNFTLRDTANNYALRCVWGPYQHYNRWKEYDEGVCQPEDSSIARLDHAQERTLVNLKEFGFEGASNSTPASGLTVFQEWYCPSANGSYPTIFQAIGEAKIAIGCPIAKGGTDNTTSRCEVFTPLPVTVEAKWTPPGPARAERQLIPQPNPPTPHGLDPPPQKDCTDLSLSHPDWTIERIALVPDSSLEVTLTSRALNDLQFVCHFSGKVTGEGPIKLSCARDANRSDVFNSNSVLSLEFKPGNKSLRIQHDWVCGDTKGTYKTEYRAAQNVTLPLVSSNATRNGYQLESQVTVRGELLRPLKLTPSVYPFPPNTSTKSCTSNSAKPSWIFDTFFVIETSTDRVNAGEPEGKPEVIRTYGLDFTNKANGYRLSCSMKNWRDAPEWFRCNRAPEPGEKIIDTFVKFNVTTNTFSLNQTWYCNDTSPASPPTRFIGGGSIKPTYCGWQNTTRTQTCSSRLPAGSICELFHTSRWCAFTRWDDPYNNGRITGGNPQGRIQGNLTSSTALPSNEFTSPDPTEFSCTANSVGRPTTWRFIQNDGPFIATSWMEQSNPSYVRTAARFGLEVSALFPRYNETVKVKMAEYDWPSLTPYLSEWDPSKTYEYNKQGGWYYKDFDNWKAKFDVSTGYLEFNATWECSDKHPGWRTVFTGSWRGYVPLNCTVPAATAKEMRVQCDLRGGELTVVPEVRVEWGYAGGPEPLVISSPDGAEVASVPGVQLVGGEVQGGEGKWEVSMPDPFVEKGEARQEVEARED